MDFTVIAKLGEFGYYRAASAVIADPKTGRVVAFAPDGYRISADYDLRGW